MEKKTCKNCNISLDIDSYYKTINSKAYPDNRINWCKDCMRQYKKEKRVKKEKPCYSIEQVELTMTFD